MSKVTESEKLRAEAEQITKAFNERKDALGKELEEVKKALEEKKVEVVVVSQVSSGKLQQVYYQGQNDCIASVRPEVQKNP